MKKYKGIETSYSIPVSRALGMLYPKNKRIYNDPFAEKIVSDAVNKIPDDTELGEKLIEVCLVILKKAVKLTKTDMYDKLLEQVEKALVAR